MNTDTITIGNVIITAEDIGIVSVKKCHNSIYSQYFVEIQISRKIITENGLVETIYKNQTYPCTEEEYDKFLKELYGEK